jgi:metallo-beta-lactamase class B
MRKIVLIVACCFCLQGFSQKTNEEIRICDDVEILKIADNIYLHKSYKESEKWGRIPANGLVYVNKRKAFLFDTPWNNEQTEFLINWIEDSLKTKVVGFIPNHWHDDCMGGLSCVHSKNIKSYAHQMTIDTAIARGVLAPEYGFKDSLKLHLGKKDILCYYPGAAHSHDNIIIYLPTEGLLFAGCVLKGMEYKNIGFTGDGNIHEYPNTLKKILKKFPDAKIIVPGHGNYGGMELIHHNIKLANKLL